MARHGRIGGGVAGGLGAALLVAAVGVPWAAAAGGVVANEGEGGSGAVVSVRSFKGVKAESGRAAGIQEQSVSRGSFRDDLLAESISVGVDDGSDWGGIETLDVPQTESPAEKKAREEAEARAKAEEQAKALAAQAATRTGTGSGIASGGSTAVPNGAGSSQVIQIAQQYIGVPYVYGGSSPQSGFDCSGLTQYVYAQLGIALPHQSEGQRVYAQAHGVQVSAADAQPGDLMWQYGHVGIYAGDGKILHAPQPGEVVSVWDAGYSAFEYYRLL